MSRIKLQLYLEGMQVPITSARIIGEIGSPLSCIIDVPPAKCLKKLRPRTWVHAFFYDDTLPPPKKGEEDTRWRLLFEGEYLGYGFRKGHGDFAMNLSCMDLSGYWENALQFYANLASAFGLGFTAKVRFMGMEAEYSLFTNLQIEGSIFQKVNDSKSLLEASLKILGDIGSINRFFGDAESRLKLTSRIMSKTSENMAKLFEIDYISKWLKQQVGAEAGSKSLLFVLNMFLKVIYHDWAINNSASYIGNKLISFLIKPNLFFASPPRCNVFFPDRIDSMDFQQSYLQEPTRIMMNSYTAWSKDPQGENIGTLNATMFPEEVAKAMTSIGKFKDYLTEEEREKGIIPILTSMDAAQALYNSGSGKKGVSKIDTYAKQAAKYDYLKYKYQSRAPLPVNLGFTPGIAGGFPAAVIDRKDLEYTFLGYIINWQHTVIANGIGSTIVQLGFPRQFEEQITPLPDWFDNKYDDGRIGEDVYQHLLGCDSFYKKITDVQKIMEEYRAHLDKGWVQKYIDDFTRRNIASKKEVFEFIGAESKDGVNYSGPFIGEANAEKYGIPNKQEPVIEYLKEIKYQGQKV